MKGACLEIFQIVNDWRAEVVGGLESGLMLWEKCIIPSLLHGAGTWVEMTPDTVKRLNGLQAWFLRVLLQVGPGVPTAELVAMMREAGVADSASEEISLPHFLEFVRRTLVADLPGEGQAPPGQQRQAVRCGRLA